MSLYKEKLLDEISKGNPVLLPNQLARVGSVYNTVPARYKLVGSVSGVGKTSFVDDTEVLKPFDYIKRNDIDIHYETLYYSMERQMRYKLAKWSSWKIFQDTRLRLHSDVILGYHPSRKLSKEEHELVKKVEPWMDELLEMVDLRDGQQSVSTIANDIKRLRLKLGTWFTTDEKQLYENGKPTGLRFKGDIIKTKRGDVPIVNFQHKGKSYQLKQNDKLYIYNNPRTIVNIVVDHIGKTKVDSYGTKKLAIDALDEVMADARDSFSFNPILISQFNRSLSDINRLKYSKGNLEPMYEDFKDSGNTVESADLVLSLFNPYKYNSYDESGMYKGYDILQGTLAPNGSQRFRSLHVLKNSFGIDNVTFGLLFMGETMYFETLPKPDETTKLRKIYKLISQG
jgi:hypothetical protein